MNRTWFRSMGVALALAISLPGAGAFGQQDRYGKPEPFDASVQTLRQALRTPPGGGRNPSMVGLLELNDPEMRPLFQALLLQPSRPLLQADAVLGLAQIDHDKTVDPFVIRQVQDKRLRSEVLKTLIGRDLLKEPEINQILSWKDDELLPEDRLFLVATLQRHGWKWQPAALEALKDHKGAEIAALRALLLHEIGKNEEWEEFRGVIAEMPPQDRDALLALLAPALRSYNLKGSVDPLLKIASDRAVDANVRAAIVGSALELDPPAGLAAMRDEVSRDRSKANLLRYALLLLVVADKPGVDMKDFDTVLLEGDEELATLMDAARAAKNSQSCVAPLNKLIDMGLRPAAEWALTVAAKRPPQEATQIYSHVLDLARQARDPRESILIIAVKAAKEQIKIDQASVEDRILNPATTPPVQEALALALADSANREAAQLASRVHGKLQRRLDSMCLLAMAKGDEPLSKADLDQLGVIASGGGRVDGTLQAQAAWLYLKASNKHLDALAKLTAE